MIDDGAGGAGSVVQGWAEGSQILAPGEELLWAELPPLDAEGLGRGGPGPVGDAAAEVGPQRGDLKMGLQPAAPLGDAPGAPAQARQEVAQPGVGVIDREERVRPVAPGRGGVPAPLQAGPEQGT